jgi:hypothetical protein
VQSRGSLLVCPGAGATQTFAGLSFGEFTAAKTDSPFEVTKWNELEGPLARTEEGYGVPLGPLEVFQRAAISGSGAVLASFQDGAPFLVRKALGRGEVYFCATVPHAEWSSLADGPVLVPMVQRLIASGSKRLNSGVMMECGEAGAGVGANWKRIDADVPANPRFDAGVYQVDNRYVAVNRPAAENNPAVLSAEQVGRLFRDVPFQLHEERGRAGDRLHGEIWRVFVTLMLIFLILEGILILPSKAKYPERREGARAPRPAEVPA